MEDTLRDFMKDIIEEENQKAVDKAILSLIKNAMNSQGWDAGEVMNNLGIPASDQARYASML